jgi:hypothetical protein
MKMKYLLSFMAVLLIFTNGFSQKEITVPCAENGKSDAHFFRASSSAKSKDLSMSKDKSLLSTKQILASLIGSTMKSVTENYTSQLDQSKASSVKSSFENLINETVNQQLKFVSITCQKTDKPKDGMYETYTSVEMPKDEFYKTFTSKVSSDSNLKTDFDESKFREIFDKENTK